jgi:hypothetical protein
LEIGDWGLGFGRAEESTGSLKNDLFDDDDDIGIEINAELIVRRVARSLLPATRRFTHLQ